MVVQRHAKAKKLEAGQPDRSRLLAPEGVVQATAMREQLTAKGLLPAKLVIASPALRVVETVYSPESTQIYLPELYLPDDDTVGGVELERLFNLLGYVSLEEYRKYDSMNVIGEWAKKAERALKSAVVQNYRWNLRAVHVGCHAILSNALALEIINGRNPRAREQILKHPLGEAGCLILNPNAATVEILELEP